MGFNVGPAGVLQEEEKLRTAQDVLEDIYGWVEWFDRLNLRLSWFEIPAKDLALIDFIALPFQADRDHTMARYKIKRVDPYSIDSEDIEVLLISEPTTTSIVGHSLKDPI